MGKKYPKIFISAKTKIVAAAKSQRLISVLRFFTSLLYVYFWYFWQTFTKNSARGGGRYFGYLPRTNLLVAKCYWVLVALIQIDPTEQFG
jgi:hypothetical protein